MGMDLIEAIIGQNWKRKAKKLWPGFKPSRMHSVARAGDTVFIAGWDVDVVIVLEGADIKKVRDMVALNEAAKT
jgi:hypothetical protein